MLVQVAEFGATLDHYDFEVDLEVSPSSEIVLYVPIPRRFNLFQLDSLLSAQKAPWRNSAQTVVFRAHGNEALELRRGQLAELLAERFENMPLWVLRYSGGRHRLEHIPASATDTAFESRAQDIISALRQAELMALTRRSGAHLPGVRAFHYVGPNLSHYEHFLRVGTALQTLDALDGVSFWLVPYFQPWTILVLDSGSILPLGLNWPRYLVDCGHASADAPIVIECLRRYGELAGEVAGRVARFVEGVPGVSPSKWKVLLLVSVASSGRTAERIVEALSGLDITNVTVVSLYGPSEQLLPGDTLCRLDSRFRRYDRAACPRCKRRNPFVKIEPDTYLLELTAAVARTRITEEVALPAKTFVTLYKGSGCISVHRDRHENSRHHSVHVDVGILCDHPAFTAKVGNLVARIVGEVGRVDAVLAPTHSAAAKLARLVASELTCGPPILCEESDLSGLGSEDAERLTSADFTLIVDDAVLTGKRLRRYKAFLHDAGLRKTGSRLGLLVGLARPPTSDDLEGIRDYVSPHFYPVEELLLPNWQQQDCPWCWELAQLEAAGTQISGLSMVERHERLRRKIEASELTSCFSNGLPAPRTSTCG